MRWIPPLPIHSHRSSQDWGGGEHSREEINSRAAVWMLSKQISENGCDAIALPIHTHNRDIIAAAPRRSDCDNIPPGD